MGSCISSCLDKDKEIHRTSAETAKNLELQLQVIERRLQASKDKMKNHYDEGDQPAAIAELRQYKQLKQEQKDFGLLLRNTVNAASMTEKIRLIEKTEEASTKIRSLMKRSGVTVEKLEKHRDNIHDNLAEMHDLTEAAQLSGAPEPLDPDESEQAELDAMMGKVPSGEKKKKTQEEPAKKVREEQDPLMLADFPSVPTVTANSGAAPAAVPQPTKTAAELHLVQMMA